MQMDIKKILVTGANGQLGNEMRRVSKSSGNHYVRKTFRNLSICSPMLQNSTSVTPKP